MAFFVLTSDITIGSFNLSGVNNVRVQRSIHSYEDRATITLPAIAKIKNKDNGITENVPTNTKFNRGDSVHINLGYNGNVDNEFVGFVKRIGLGTPLIIECEGYSYQLRNRGNLTADFRKEPISVKDLLQIVVKGTDITVQCPIDAKIIGIKLVKFNGAQICDIIKEVSDHTLCIFFIAPKVLWCGLVYSAYATNNAPNVFGFPTVKYRLGFNCIRDNGLKERLPDEVTQVIFQGKYATGNLLYNASKEKAAKNKYTHLSSQIADDESMGKFAQEKAFKLNYKGYEGKLNAFLVPYANPGFDAYIVCKQNPKLDGTYLIEATDVTFGIHGAKRVLDIGARVGFDTEQIN